MLKFKNEKKVAVELICYWYWIFKTEPNKWNIVQTYLKKGYLTLLVPIPDEEKKINWNFYFHTSLWCVKRFYEGLIGLHKTLWGNTKKCYKKKFFFWFLFWYHFLKCTVREGLKTTKKYRHHETRPDNLNKKILLNKIFARSFTLYMEE